MLKHKKILFLALTVVFLFLIIGANFAYAAATSLKNPLGDGVDDPRAIVGNVIKALFGIVGSLALAIFIFGGFTWVTSAGNEEKIKKGKDMIMWAAFGLIVVFASYALVTFVLSALTGASTSDAVTEGVPDAVTEGS